MAEEEGFNENQLTYYPSTKDKFPCPPDILPERYEILRSYPVIEQIEEIMSFKPENIKLSQKQMEKLAPFLGLKLDNPEQCQARLAHVISNFPFFYAKDGKELIANFFYCLSEFNMFISDAIEKPDSKGNNPYGNPAEIPEPLHWIEHIKNMIRKRRDNSTMTPLNLKLLETCPEVYEQHKKIIERFLKKRPSFKVFIVEDE